MFLEEARNQKHHANIIEMKFWAKIYINVFALTIHYIWRFTVVVGLQITFNTERYTREHNLLRYIEGTAQEWFAFNWDKDTPSL